VQYGETEAQARANTFEIVGVYLEKYRHQSDDPLWKQTFGCTGTP
jgi:hypothetical protein